MESKFIIKFSEFCFKLIFIFLLIIISIYIGILIYASSFYIHESGHIIFGFTDNLLLHGKIAKFTISSWVVFPLTPFKIPQQARIIDGTSSWSFTFGGIMFTILVMTSISYYFYNKSINKNKKYVFIIPIIFLIHEIIGNFLCGTDNLYTKEYAICYKNQIINYIIKSIPFLLAVPLLLLIYSYIKEVPYFKKLYKI